MHPLIIVGIIVAVFAIIILGGILAVNYFQTKIYDKRSDGTLSIIYPLPHDDPSIEVKRDYFVIKKDTRLYTYEYKLKENKQPKGFILVIHGVGSGHNYMIPLIRHLCREGFVVLTYDHYASGSSEGYKFDSMISGARYVKYALKYVEEHYKDYPLYVLGHSMGGYVASVALKLSKNIRKCMVIAGFNTEYDMGRGRVKPYHLIRVLMVIRSFFYYGKYAFISALDGMKSTDAKVLYMQGLKDTTVPPEVSGLYFEKKLKCRENIQFKFYENKGHTPFVISDEKNDKNYSYFSVVGGGICPLDVYYSYEKTSVPDPDVYKFISDFFEN